MQHDSQTDLIPAWQDGNLSAARQITSTFQSEAISVAYLLTGDRDAAVALAETGFLRLLRMTTSGDPDIDARLTLLNLIGQSYLRDDFRERVQPDVGGLLIESAPNRFQVDDRRTLLLAALGRLDNRERAILILRDFSGLDTSEITRLQERRGEPLVAPMETARQRIRQSVDIPAGDPLRPTFVEATFNAPRVDIWSRIEDDVTAIQARSRNQSRLISIGIVAVVMLVLVGGMLALLDSGGDGDDSNNFGAQPAGEPPTSLPAGPTVGQSIDMEPTPTPEPAASITANVPSWLLIETTHQQLENEPYRSLSVFDPSIGDTLRLPSNDSIRLAAGAEGALFSPDGYQMTFFREDLRDDGMHYYLTSYSTSSIARQWETEVLTLPSTGDELSGFGSESHVPVRFASALTGNRAYAAFLTTDTEPKLEIHSYFSRNGMPRGSVEIDLPLQTPDTRIFRGNIMLHAPPNSDRLYLLVESFGDSVDQWRAALMTFDRQDLTLIGERNISADPNQGYWLWDSQLTADGTALYGVHESRSSGEVRAQFLELETGEVTTIQLPFTAAANRLESVMTVSSHDGQRIYVLDRMGTSVAVVNLHEREIERVFPLDRSAGVQQLGLDEDDQIFGQGSALSADGSRLFIASWDHDGTVDERRQQGIWTIDTSRWELTGFIPVGGMIDGIFLSPAENVIHAQIWLGPYSSSRRELVSIVTDSEPAVVERIQLPDSGANFSVVRSPAHHYRTQYGRSPAIDNVPAIDLTAFSTLPVITTETPDGVVSVGQNAAVEIRIIDPVSGEPLAESRPDVRFDPGTNITMTLRQENRPAQLVILVQVRPGVYAGTVNFPAAGDWTVDVDLIDGSGETSTRQAVGLIGVTPALSGSDGRNYAFQVSTVPDIPYAREETVVQLQLVDTDTGQPLPDDVTVEIVDGNQPENTSLLLPERIDVRFSPDDSGVLTARLNQTGPGTYQGTVSFWSSGAWSGTIQFQPDDGPPISLPASAVMVSGT